MTCAPWPILLWMMSTCTAKSPPPLIAATMALTKSSRVPPAAASIASFTMLVRAADRYHPSRRVELRSASDSGMRTMRGASSPSPAGASVARTMISAMASGAMPQVVSR